MSPKTPSDETLLINKVQLITLATEYWRLNESLGGSTASNLGLARQAVRKLGDLLSSLQIEARSLTGQPFDAGLAARVIDTFDDDTRTSDIVDETISPLILWRSEIVRPAEIVVRRGTLTR